MNKKRRYDNKMNAQTLWVKIVFEVAFLFSYTGDFTRFFIGDFRLL